MAKRTPLQEIENHDFKQLSVNSREILENILGYPIEPRGVCFGTERLAVEKVAAGMLILACIRFAALRGQPKHPQDAWAAKVIGEFIEELLHGDTEPSDEEKKGFGELMGLAMLAYELRLEFMLEPEAPLEIQLSRIASELPLYLESLPA